MSISVIVQPPSTNISIGGGPVFIVPINTILSAGNDNIYTVSGTTLGAANVFEYKYIADIYVNGVLQVTLKSFPDPNYGFGVFNTRNILTSFIAFDFFPTLPAIPERLFNQCPNSSCKAQLVFGEEYISGSTFIQNRNLASGTTATFINASQPFTDEVNNPLSSYLITPGTQAMTSRQGSPFGSTNPTSPSVIVYNSYVNQMEQLYVIARTYGICPVSGSTTEFIGSTTYSWVNSIQVRTYNAAGTNLGKYNIYTGFKTDGSIGGTGASGSTSGGTDVMQISIGYNALAAITSASPNVAVSSGSMPIITASVAYYSIYITGNYNWGPSNFGPSPGLLTKPIYYFPIVDCGRFATGAYTISWLNPYGGFNTWLFNKKNETTQNIQRQSYKKIQGKIQSNGSYTLNTNSRSEVPYYTVLKDSIVMYTDFITDSDVLYLKSLISSPVVYMTDQTGLVTSVVVKDGSYRINKKVNQKIYSLEMTVEQSYNDFRQVL